MHPEGVMNRIDFNFYDEEQSYQSLSVSNVHYEREVPLTTYDDQITDHLILPMSEISPDDFLGESL